MFKYSEKIRVEGLQLSSEQEEIIREYVEHDDVLRITSGSAENLFEVWNDETDDYECSFDTDENIIF